MWPNVKTAATSRTQAQTSLWWVFCHLPVPAYYRIEKAKWSVVWYQLNKMRRFSVQSSQERLVYFWLLDTVTVAAHPMSSFTQEAQDRVCSQPLWLSRELYHLWFQLLTSSLAVSHFCNPISFSPQFLHLFLLIFYISHITVSTSNAFFLWMWRIN